MKSLLYSVIALCFLSTYSQKTTYNTAVSAEVYLGEDELPYWFYTNQHGQLDAQTNFLGLAEQNVIFNLSENSSIELKGGLLYSDGIQDDFIIDQLYAKFKNKWVIASLGVFHEEEELDGLSSTNNNILWSGNSRSLPGILVEANAPIKLFKGLSIDWGLGHYELNDDRDVDGAMVHYKRLGATYAFSEKSKFTIEVQHFVQWGGTSPRFGELPSGFSDYIDIFFASRAGDENAPEGEQINALGNHLGSFNLNYEGKIGDATFQLYHQHLFEDGSGTSWNNFPDGLWGSYLKLDNSIIKSVLYEYVHTINQGGFGRRNGNDDYFKNGIYRSGWRYNGRTIGVPFIIPTNIDTGTGTTRVRAHHLGLTAAYKKFDFNFKASYVQSLGTFINPIIPKIETIYTYGSTTYKTETYGAITLLAGIDAISGAGKTKYGLGFQYKYAF